MPRRANTILVAVLTGILIPLVVAAALLVVLRQGGREVVVAPITARATQTALAQAPPTATAGVVGNPDRMTVTPPSCARPVITWSWSGATGATAFDVALYDPASGDILARNTTREPRFSEVAPPGQMLGLKVRARNGAAAAPDFFAPASGVARVPDRVTNPTAISVLSAGPRRVWVWSGATGTRHFAVVRYHYAGPRVIVDQQGEVTGDSIGAVVTGTTVYYLKVRALGPCAPATWYTPGPASAAHG